VALTAEQVAELALPAGPKAKAGSSRRKRFVEEYGEHVFEMEAVEPEELQEILREHIESVLDMELFRAEQAIERQDAAYIRGVNKTIQDVLANLDFE
jgi:hypothetical protein